MVSCKPCSFTVFCEKKCHRKRKRKKERHLDGMIFQVQVLPVILSRSSMHYSMLIRCWYRKLCLFYNAFKNEHPKYLFNLILVRSTPPATRTVGNIPLIKTKHNFFKKNFFPSAIIKWNHLDPNLRNSKSISVFKEKILNFI